MPSLIYPETVVTLAAFAGRFSRKGKNNEEMVKVTKKNQALFLYLCFIFCFYSRGLFFPYYTTDNKCMQRETGDNFLLMAE